MDAHPKTTAIYNANIKVIYSNDRVTNKYAKE
jgi:hypothetical protein